MKHYSEAAVERMMKVQEVILRAIAGKLRWWEAAEILGVSDRTMRRWRWRYQQHGYDALYDRRKGKPSPKRVPLKTVEKVCKSTGFGSGLPSSTLGDYFLSRSCQSSCQRFGGECNY
jgi:Helix-turn-helix domain